MGGGCDHLKQMPSDWGDNLKIVLLSEFTDEFIQLRQINLFAWIMDTRRGCQGSRATLKLLGFEPWRSL